MEEKLITFETAKLAKEKEFYIKTLNYYSDDAGIEGYLVNHNSNGKTFSRPTQSLLQKWLREKYKIDLTVMIRFADSYSVIIHQNRNVIKEYTGDNFITRLLRKRNRTVENYSTKEIIVDPTPENIKRGIYEEALEKGLQEALKLIK